MKQWLMVLLLAAALAGCSDSPADTADDGGDDGNDGNGGDGGNGTANPPALPVDEVAVQLTGIYPVNTAYTPDPIAVKHNTTIRLTFSNTDLNQVMNHDWVLEDVEGVATATIAVGESDTIEFMAPDVGDYLFYCSLPGHRGNGMEGTFTVTA